MGGWDGEIGGGGRRPEDRAREGERLVDWLVDLLDRHTQQQQCQTEDRRLFLLDTTLPALFIAFLHNLLGFFKSIIFIGA